MLRDLRQKARLRALFLVILQPFLEAHRLRVGLLCVRHLERLMRLRYIRLRLRVRDILYLIERKYVN
jgi:hypothetical protein